MSDNDEKVDTEELKSVLVEGLKVPDLYTDATVVSVGAYDVTLSLSHETPVSAGEVARVPAGFLRMSHSHAWVVAHLLLQNLSRLVKANGMFMVPKDVLERLALTDEYEEMARKADG